MSGHFLRASNLPVLQSRSKRIRVELKIIDGTWQQQFLIPLPLCKPVFTIVIYG